MIPFIGTGSNSIAILEGWDLASGIPLEATAKGGEMITIHGYGFDYGSSDYSCLFPEALSRKRVDLG